MEEFNQSKYCYEGTNTLINQLNIKNTKELLQYEAKITALKSLSLRQQGVTGNFDKQHYLSIHRYLFEDIYPFAGELRKENIAKGAFRFAEWEYIEQELEKLLEKLKKENFLQGLVKNDLAIKLAYYLSELNVLHPFREGNGRTNREFIRQLALKNGYQLNLKKIAPAKILEASIKSIVDTTDLENILTECLEN
ncbi:MAG: Fic family protein [Clostridia bacterium]|nr:Fic family protein [Clostridia bacterium]